MSEEGSTVQVLHLVDGTVVVGQVMEIDSSVIVVKNPLRAKMVDDGGVTRLYLSHYDTFSDTEDVAFNNSGIISAYVVGTKLLELYRSYLSEDDDSSAEEKMLLSEMFSIDDIRKTTIRVEDEDDDA